MRAELRRCGIAVLPVALALAAGCSPAEQCRDLCGEVCVDVRSDVLHCGACDAACAAGEQCVSGACVVSCQSGLADCGASCRDLQADPAHCGACGFSCAAGEVCSGGACALSCAAGFADCSGACRDLQADSASCGACGNTCAPGERCAAGACVLTCQADLTSCAGTCRDLQTDAANCGACGTACAAGERCASGACVLSCQGTLTDCGGTCRDLQSDPAHCGACAAPCPSGQVCSAGACVASCGTGLTDCANACVATQSDPQHCGACDAACAAAANTVPACVAGSCSSVCDPGFADCNATPADGCEVDLRVDLDHCNACGNVCPFRANASRACGASTGCGMSCDPGFDDCNADEADGCEAELAVTPEHCGACNAACPARANAASTCAAGTCGFVCLPGFVDCNGNAADGCEVNTALDPANCGTCGSVCAANTCFAGQCARVAFVTSTTYSSNLGGLTGADALCQAHATAGNLPGTFMAWLSDSAASPATRFNRSTVPYLRVDGVKIANSYIDLTDQSLLVPINVTELGTAPPDGTYGCGGTFKAVWTATQYNGTAFGGHCTDWTGTGTGSTWGITTSTSAGWTLACFGGTCGGASAIYCFQQ